MQVAVGGRWEDAARVDASTGHDAVAELTRILPIRGESALEVFARDGDGCVAFIGVRFDDRAHDELEDVLSELLAVAFVAGGSLQHVASWLSVAIGAPLFESDYSGIEVGVIDAWISGGAVRLAPIPEPSLDVAEQALLDAARRLVIAPDRVIAAEFVRSTPVPHWIGFEIARSTTGGDIVPTSIRAAAEYLVVRHGPAPR